MTVNETLIVCKVLQENGYGDYVMTNQCGYDTLCEYTDYIIDRDEHPEINMEGGCGEKYADLPINKLIYEALAKYKKGTE